MNRNEAKQALLAQVSAKFDTLVALVSDAPSGTKFSFEALSAAIGTEREASRVVYEADGETPKTITDDKGKTTKLTQKVSVREESPLSTMIADALASTGEFATESHGRNSGLWVGGAVPKAAPVAASALKSEIAALKAELAALRSK